MDSKTCPSNRILRIYCTLCSQVCPTGAIRELKIEEKEKIKIGLAFIDKNRCLPYSQGINCIVCEEHCPTSPKAIKFIRIKAKKPNGSVKKPLAPVVDYELCVGCGICENKCPVVDKPAIYVTSIGETRSEKNQLILEYGQDLPKMRSSEGKNILNFYDYFPERR